MNPRDQNIQLLEAVVRALTPVLDRVVFVGGCTIGLLITDSTRPPVRATQDVDMVVELASRHAYYAFSEELRALGLVEDPEVICRWKLGTIKVDVMPTDEETLGFSNRWYPRVLAEAQTRELPSGAKIQLATAPLMLATKFEAFRHRGEFDYGGSHDMEDIVNLVDGRPELVAEVLGTDEELRSYLQNEVDELLADTYFAPTVVWHLRPDAEQEEREEIVLRRFMQIAGHEAV